MKVDYELADAITERATLMQSIVFMVDASNFSRHKNLIDFLAVHRPNSFFSALDTPPPEADVYVIVGDAVTDWELCLAKAMPAIIAFPEDLSTLMDAIEVMAVGQVLTNIRAMHTSPKLEIYSKAVVEATKQEG